jgi:hypothetical protein
VSAKKSLETNEDLIWQVVVMGLLGVARWSSAEGEIDAETDAETDGGLMI